MLKTANKQYQPKIQRGSSYKFMWLDVNTENKWAQQFQFDSYPQLIVLNPGRRKRYVKLEADINLSNIGNFKPFQNNSWKELMGETPDLFQFQNYQSLFEIVYLKLYS